MEIVWTADPPPRLPVVLAVALMRPPVFRRVLQTAAAMGVLEIHVFQSHRVEKSFWQSSALAAQDVDRQLVLGLEQARDTVMPQVMFHPRFSAFTRDILPGLVDGRTGMVAHPSGPRLQASGFQPPALVLIGPEGGFIDRELAVFQSAGCSLVSLGPRILRVETAVAVLLASFL
jgi:RsmE family RNA methyltransferase